MRNVFFKVAAMVIVVIFVLSLGALGVYASSFTNDHLKASSARATQTQRDIQGSLDGGTAQDAVLEIYPENLIRGAEKMDDVGQSLNIFNAISMGVTGGFWGHSANFGEFVKNGLKMGATIENILAAYDEKINGRVLEFYKQGGKKYCLCVGDYRKEEISLEEQIASVKLQLDRRLKGVTQEQLQQGIMHLAFEPTSWIGTGKAEDPNKVKLVHQAVYEWFEAKYGKDTTKAVWGNQVKMLYGASVDNKNAPGLLAQVSDRADIAGTPMVHGFLFASFGKKASGFIAVGEILNKVAQERNAQYVNFVNLKSFKDSDKTAIAQYVQEVYAAVRDGKIDPKHTIMAIADQDALLKDWIKSVKVQEKIRAATSLENLGASIASSETTGAYTREILSVKGDGKALARIFGEPARGGDVYSFLKKGSNLIALAKENAADQQLVVSPLVELSDLQAKTDFYGNVLDYASLKTAIANKGLELILANGMLFKEFITSSDSALGTKHFYGRDKFFQLEYKAPAPVAADARPTLLTFKESDHPIARGWSAIVQPKYNVLINGYGTIGSKVAHAARESGFNVVIGSRSVSSDSIDGVEYGFPLYLSDTKNQDAFKAAGLPVAGVMADLLASGGVDVVVDGTPSKVGAANIVNVYNKYPNVKVIVEGGEKENVAEASFNSSTDFYRIVGKRIVRVVSCNTTGMSRIYGDLLAKFPHVKIRNFALRRSADPSDEKGSNPDSFSMNPVYHHGPDFKSVLKPEVLANLDAITTPAGEGPWTHYHVHAGTISAPGLTVDEVVKTLKAHPRVALVKFEGDEFKTTKIFDIYNSRLEGANHPYVITAMVKASDLPGEIDITYAVPQESNVVPENVNALQAMFGLFEQDAAIKLVNDVMGINKIKQGIEVRMPITVGKDGGSMISKREPIGPYVKEIFYPKSEATASFYKSVESMFGENTEKGDVYAMISRGDDPVAYIKENAQKQQVIAAPVSASVSQDVFTAAVLESLTVSTARDGKGRELIIENGNMFRDALAFPVQFGAKEEALDLPGLAGTKHWYGRSKFFQLEYKSADAAADARPTLLTFKESDHPIARGWSAIVQPKYNVLINGYGTIGSKVAHAARESGFNVVIGSRSVSSDSIDGVEYGFPLYLSDTKNQDAFKAAGLPVAGVMADLLASGGVDVVVDGTPSKVGAANIVNVYNKYPNVKVIVEGGEKENVAEASFNSSTDFYRIVGKRIVRVVSCNTTGMSRIYGDLLAKFPHVKIRNFALRRSADPSDEKGSNPDSFSMNPVYHHGPDFKSVLKPEVLANLDAITTPAGEGPWTHYHVHAGTISAPGLTVDEVVKTLKAHPRVALVKFEGDEFKTTKIFDIYNSRLEGANHPYVITAMVKASDLPGEIDITYAVPQESNVVPENVNALQAMFGLFEQDAAIKLVNDVMGINKIKQGIEVRMPIETVNKDGGIQVRSMERLAAVLADTGIDTGFLVGDLNVGREGATITDDERIRIFLPTLVKALTELGAQEYFVLTHSGRPEGTRFEEAFSLVPVVEHLKKLANEENLLDNVVIEVLPYDLKEAAAKIAEVRLANKGKKIVFVLENIRFYAAEKSKDAAERKAFEEQLIALTGKPVDQLFYINEAFDKAHRGEEASMELVQLIPADNRAAGPSLKESLDKVIAFQGKVTGSFSTLFGGAKFDKYKQAGALAKKIAKTNGKLIIVGALADPYLASQGIEVGKSKMPTKPADLKEVTKGLPKIAESKAAVMYPVDFVVKGLNEPQDKLGTDMSQMDIGPKTANQIVDYINSLKPGDGIVLNGGAGVFEKPEYREGTKKIILADSEAAGRGVAVFEGGGDINAAHDLVEDELGKALNKAILRSKGGGSLLEALAKGVENLAPVAALITQGGASEAAQTVSGQDFAEVTAKALKVEKQELEKFISGDNAIYNAFDGDMPFDLFVKKMQQTAAKDLAAGKQPTIVMSTSFFKLGGATTAVSRLFQMDALRLVIYGENADNIKLLLGNPDIITAKDLAFAEKKIAGFSVANTVLLGTSEDVAEAEQVTDISKIIVSKKIPVNVALSKAVASVVRTDSASVILADFYKGLENVAINKQSQEAREAMLAELQEGMQFEFSDSVTATTEVAKLIDASEMDRATFINKV